MGLGFLQGMRLFNTFLVEGGKRATPKKIT